MNKQYKISKEIKEKILKRIKDEGVTIIQAAVFSDKTVNFL